MHFPVKKIFAKYDNIFVYFGKESYDFIPDEYIPEGFERGTIGDRLQIPVLFAKGKIDSTTLNYKSPEKWPIDQERVFQYQPELDVTFYSWIRI